MTSPYELKDTLLTIDKVGLAYGSTPVLNALSAEVRDIVRPGCVTGQIIGILGPSGIGKTQLSRVMTGLQEPSAGRVLVGPKQVPVRAGMVGYVAQNYLLLRHRTVLGNLMLAAQRSGFNAKGARERAQEYLEKFSLSTKWDAYPAQLSGGQRQRVAIAQQLLCSEHYLVMDEPTTGLDPIMKDKVCELIKTVASMSEENTIFCVTHDIPAILTIADHLWLMGRVRDEDGTSRGARILQTYDLIERGIAWQDKPHEVPAFAELQKEIRDRFSTL